MPIDFDRDENGYLKEHKCIHKTMAYKKRFKKCWNCPKQITFSSKMVSQREKKIPCEIIESTGRLVPHNCPFNYERTLKYRERQIVSECDAILEYGSKYMAKLQKHLIEIIKQN
jgi:hypothetical protein